MNNPRDAFLIIGCSDNTGNQAHLENCNSWLFAKVTKAVWMVNQLDAG